MNDIKIEITERLPVFRKCPNCNGDGYRQILVQDDFSSGGAMGTMTTCSCHECNGQGMIPTGDFAYHTPQGLILEEK